MPVACCARAGWRITVDHWQGGIRGCQEFGLWHTRRARPFLTGLLGFTRYAAAGNNEFRFTVAARASRRSW